MPSQDRRRRDDHPDPTSRRQPHRQGGDHGSVRPGQPRTADLPQQYGELMPKDQDLDILRRL